MGLFIITKRTNGDYQFNLKATNGQIILTSEGYSTKNSCHRGIQSVIENSQIDSQFDRKTSTNGFYYFILKARNGEIIGVSQMYASEAGRENGIYSVKINAIQSQIADKS